jgi:two-component system phosphate regulon response regulator OmpR
VDDDERLRGLLHRYLTSNGYRVTAAADAADARALMKGIAFDLLVLDVMMPGESGFDLTKSLRSHSQVPILILTA